MNKPVVIFHAADFDGLFCAVVATQHLDNPELYPYDYGRHIDLSYFDDRKVYIVDVSLSANQMRELYERSDELHYIDHHKHAVKEIKEAVPDMEGSWDLEDNYSASYLLWRYLAKEDANVPWLLHHVDRWDVWDHSDKDTLYVQAFLKAEYQHLLNRTPETISVEFRAEIRDLVAVLRSVTWKGPLHKEIRDRGEVAYDQDMREKNLLFKTLCHPITIDGRVGLAANMPYRNLLYTQQAVEKAEIDVEFCLFYWRQADGRWKLSFRGLQENDLDVSTLAALYGGRGHSKAAGAVVNDFPFSVKRSNQ